MNSAPALHLADSFHTNFSGAFASHFVCVANSPLINSERKGQRASKRRNHRSRYCLAQ